jgi:hypothetical protein
MWAMNVTWNMIVDKLVADGLGDNEAELMVLASKTPTEVLLTTKRPGFFDGFYLDNEDDVDHYDEDSDANDDEDDERNGKVQSAGVNDGNSSDDDGTATADE